MTTAVSPMLNAMERDQLVREIQQLRQLLVNADAVAKSRFCLHGLCDSIDNGGTPYPSQWSHDVIVRAKTSVVVDINLARWAG